ncbi:MAG: helix-turn-helix domain-containing protein [Clostridia bacterium]
MDNNEKYLRKNIGKKIKLARSKANYTQEKLAEKLSLSTRYISQLERGIAFGSATTIINLCKALNISSDFLFDDLIHSDSSSFTELVDDKFLEAYLKLDNYNKEIVYLLITQLIKLQEKNSHIILRNIKK